MYRIGVDLGGTNIDCGIVDENYNIIGRASVKTKAATTSNGIVDAMINGAVLAAQNAKIDMKDVSYCGVGIPGWVDRKIGKVVHTTNIDLDEIYVADLMEKELNVRCGVENDANAAAFGEYVAGCGKGTNDFIAVTLGTGVGGGVIVGGKIVSGVNGAASELGHMVINIDGVPCSCGRHGCYEAYASVSALNRQTIAAMQLNKDSIMWRLCGHNTDNVNGRTSFDAWRQGDKAAAQVVDKYIEYISVGVVNLINIFQPDVICIGGAISKEGDNIILPLRKRVEQFRFPGKTDKQTVILAATLGNDAGIIGAAFCENID